MKPVHKLFGRQFVQARSATGEVDLGRLGELVSAAYEQSERDRRLTDRSVALMVEELDRLNRELERLVEERTRELREAQLKTQNMRFDATINHMSQALLMFDGSGRLMVCNQHYNDMYGLPAQFARPGKTIRELLSRRKQNGTYPGDPDDYIEKLTTDIAQGKSVSQLVELPDGRTISVLNHPMPGGGWVSTHEDITERRQAEMRIAHMARHDALTNLPNRLLLPERLAQALADVSRGQAAKPCCDGAIPSAAWSRRSSSSRWRRRSASSCRSANGCSGRHAPRPCCGRTISRSRSTSRRSRS
jgi:PAS domain-containing protein